MNQDRRWENEYHTKQIEIPEFMQQKTEPRGRRPSHNARQKTAMPVRSAVPQPRQRDRGVRPPHQRRYCHKTPHQADFYRVRRPPQGRSKTFSWYLKRYLRQRWPGLVLVFGLLLFITGFLLLGILGKKEKEASSDFTAISKKGEKTDGIQEMILPGWVIQDILPVNEYSRPGTKLQGVNGIVVHYTGNPNTTAEQNRNYYGQLAQTHETKVSSHFVIGMDGKIIQCVPLDEVAYCSNDRNGDTISIECCHKDKGGQFSDETLESLTRLLDWLVKTYDLQREQILRHYEVTGKECPKYYVEHPDEWERVLDGISFLQREEEIDGQ